MKLWKSKKSNHNNNNASSSSGGSSSTISCVPGKSSSLNKANDAKTDTATSSSTTASGKKRFQFNKKPKLLQTHWVFTIYFVWSYKQDGAWVNSGRVTFAYKSHSSFAFCLSFSITNFHNHFYYISNEASAVYSDEPFSVPQECRHKLNVSIDCTHWMAMTSRNTQFLHREFYFVTRNRSKSNEKWSCKIQLMKG